LPRERSTSFGLHDIVSNQIFNLAVVHNETLDIVLAAVDGIAEMVEEPAICYDHHDQHLKELTSFGL
jgi:hypothetical protein